MYKRVLLLILISAFFSCNEEAPVFIVPENAATLLTNDTIKTWKLAKRFNNGYRMNMGPCFMDYRVSYKMDNTILDNNSENPDCGPSLRANWTFYTNEKGSYIKLKGDLIPEILNIEKDYKFLKITTLNKDSLVLEYKHKQYSSNPLKIVDYLVPEGVKVEDRKFHH